MKQRVQNNISVGIVHNSKEIRFSFDSPYRCLQNHTIYDAGEYVATREGVMILFDDMHIKAIDFEPVNNTAFYEPKGAFSLEEVMIGIDFHWERHEKQSFKGALRILNDNSMLHAINIIDIEAYLFCVISSEMSATASLELLKAHAVISRSWLLASLGKTDNNHCQTEKITDDSVVRYYERDAHSLFDVCADDHCQRYQGITRIRSEKPLEAIKATWGEVLMYDGSICDARYSKSCGGVSEIFENCWADEHYDYLEAVSCSCNDSINDLTIEENAQSWIRSTDNASFCNTTDKEVLSQVLNNYDQETSDFYRWEVIYTQEELSETIKLRSGIDFGRIVDLVPLERGCSGRITLLKIVGEKRTTTVGKELEIRKWLSKTHLYSSAFVVDKTENDNAISFSIKGAGWGHGVGLCQIGAAVMAVKGYKYKDILLHYFKNAEIKKG